MIITANILWCLCVGKFTQIDLHADWKYRNLVIVFRIRQGVLKKKSITSIVLVFVMVISMSLTGCSKGSSGSTDKGSSHNNYIAVVNQDIGVEYSGKTVNYSEEFIKTLDKKKFKVVSGASAEEGVKKGTYAGAVFFPADLSANILNINYRNPQPIKLEYKISNKLSKASHDGIVETYNKFNNKLSYAYINALLDEVELGQYNVTAIFNNDGSNIAAARRLMAGNYSADFKMPNMPEQNVKYSNQDTRALAKSGEDYVKDIKDLYFGAYKSAYGSVKSDIESTEKPDNINDKLNNMASSINNVVTHIHAANEFKAKVEGYEKAVDAYIADNAEENKKAVAEAKEQVDNYKFRIQPRCT